MKCEKCKEREANFFYTATVNGRTSQRRLCSECAAEEGLDKAFGSFGFGGESLFDSFFDEPFGLLDSFFGRRSLFGGLMSRMCTLPRSLFSPTESAAPEQAAEAAQTEAEAKIPTDAGEAVKAERELKALRSRLQQAVEAEDFEQAIELRDKIRKLEA